MMVNTPTAARNDGRRFAVVCRTCGPEAAQTVDIDPGDDTIYVVCAECDEHLAAGEVLEADCRLSTQVGSLDQLDPRVRDGIDEVERDE